MREAADGWTDPEGRVIGYVDLGTNSIRLLVVRLNGRGAYAVLSDQKEPVRLGEGEFKTDLLAPGAMDQAVIVASRFADLARSFGALEIVAVATSATREARNRDVLLSRLRSEAGLDVHVISGKEEARLIYLGVSSSGTAPPSSSTSEAGARNSPSERRAATPTLPVSSSARSALGPSFPPEGRAERTPGPIVARSESTAARPCSGRSKASPGTGSTS